MKSEIKFEIGQIVWFVFYDQTIYPAIVNKINISQSGISYEILATYGDKDLTPITKEENETFATHEEATQSIIEELERLIVLAKECLKKEEEEGSKMKNLNDATKRRRS